MRAILLPLFLIAACGTDGSSTPAPGEAWAIDTPEFTLQPGEEKFYCFYTTLAGDAPAGLVRMASHMPTGSHHMIVFKTRNPGAPDGTLAECHNFGMDISQLSDFPVWLYASQEPDGELVMPEGVGIEVAANQHIVINMHYINTGEAPISASVHLELEPSAASYTPAHTYVTYNSKINVPAGATGTAGGACDIPAGSQFITMSTHSHQYTTSAKISDGDQVVLQTHDWAHAALRKWASPYFAFASNKLAYQCDYTNTTTQPLTAGESALANEMCMAVGVYFPATKDTFCLNSTVLGI